MKKHPLEALFEEALMEVLKEEAEMKETKPASAAEIKTLGEMYLQKNEFKPGDLAQWKPGLKNAKFPNYGEPIVVIELFSDQRRQSADGSNHALEPQNLRFGILQNEQFETYVLDANRFEPYQGE